MRLAFVLLAVAGCTIGGGPDQTPTVDSGNDEPMVDAAVGMPDGHEVTNPDAAVFMCRNRVPAGNLSSGHHNAGQNCLQGCHNHGFTLAGTLYNAATGGTAVKGGTVTVIAANGETFDMTSQANGNFYTSRTFEFPVTVIANLCPDVKPMTTKVTVANAGCNKTGCHTAAGQGRVHVP
jgi:hypothetical protein